MQQLVRLLGSRISRFLSETISIITSKDRLRRLFHIPLYSNALYLIITNAVNGLLGFAFWIIVARFYLPEDVGLASAAISAVSLLTMIANLGLGYGLIRFLPHSGDRGTIMINSCLTIGGLASVALALVFLGGLGFWSPALLFIKHNPVYLAAFLLFTVIYTLSRLTEETFVAGRRAGFTLAKSLIFNLLKIPLPILLASLFYSFGIFASWGISLAVALFISIFLFLPRVQPRYRPFPTVNRRSVNELLHFSFANYLSNLFWAVPVPILPLMVVNLLGAEPNAYFYITWTIGGVLTMIPGAASMSLFAEGSYAEDKLAINIRRSRKMVFLMLIPAVILVLAFADKILLLFGVLYSENATTLLRILAISALPVAINVIYLAIKRVEKRLRVLVGLAALAAVLNLGLSYLLLPRMGINGAGIAWLISHGAIALIIIIGWLKGHRVQHGLNSTLSLKTGG